MLDGWEIHSYAIIPQSSKGLFRYPNIRFWGTAIHFVIWDWDLIGHCWCIISSVPLVLRPLPSCNQPRTRAFEVESTKKLHIRRRSFINILIFFSIPKISTTNITLESGYSDIHQGYVCGPYVVTSLFLSKSFRVFRGWPKATNLWPFGGRDFFIGSYCVHTTHSKIFYFLSNMFPRVFGELFYKESCKAMSKCLLRCAWLFYTQRYYLLMTFYGHIFGQRLEGLDKLNKYMWKFNHQNVPICKQEIWSWLFRTRDA